MWSSVASPNKSGMARLLLAVAILIPSALPVFWGMIVIQSPTIPLRYVVWTGDFVAGRGRPLNIRMPSRRGKQH